MTLGQAVIFILLAAAAGYVFGIVDSRFTSALRKKTEKPAPAPNPAPVERNRPGEHTVLEVMIDRSFKWHLEVDGIRQDDPAAIPPEKRQRLINTIVQIRPWLDGKAAPAGPAPAAPAQEVSAVPASPVVSAPPVAVAAPVPEPVVSSVSPSIGQPAPAADGLKLNAMRGLNSMLVSDVKKQVEKKPDSLVAMIDAVLQNRLASSPLRDRGIRLEENPAGGVVVWVGVQKYPGIDAVPEPEVVAIIKAAITEWNKNR